MRLFYLDTDLPARSDGFKESVRAIIKAAEACIAHECEVLECGGTTYVGFARDVDAEAFASLVKDDVKICSDCRLSVFSSNKSLNGLYYVRMRLSDLRR